MAANPAVSPRWRARAPREPVALVAGGTVVTSSPLPLISHPPPGQLRLHLSPSQSILQLPPGHDISHISAPFMHFIAHPPLVHVWEHCFAAHVISPQSWPHSWVHLSPAQLMLQLPAAHVLSQFFAVHFRLQAPWAQLCSHISDSRLPQLTLHFPPVQEVSQFLASQSIWQGPLQFWVHLSAASLHTSPQRSPTHACVHSLAEHSILTEPSPEVCLDTSPPLDSRLQCPFSHSCVHLRESHNILEQLVWQDCRQSWLDAQISLLQWPITHRWRQFKELHCSSGQGNHRHSWSHWEWLGGELAFVQFRSQLPDMHTWERLLFLTPSQKPPGLRSSA